MHSGECEEMSTDEVGGCCSSVSKAMAFIEGREGGHAVKRISRGREEGVALSPAPREDILH